MAFLQSDTKPTTNNNRNFKKADAFLNLYMPAKDGSRRKIGFIALHNDKITDKQLTDWLNKDPEANIVKLLERLQLDYNTSEVDESKALDLE